MKSIFSGSQRPILSSGMFIIEPGSSAHAALDVVRGVSIIGMLYIIPFQ